VLLGLADFVGFFKGKDQSANSTENGYCADKVEAAGRPVVVVVPYVT